MLNCKGDQNVHKLNCLTPHKVNTQRIYIHSLSIHLIFDEVMALFVGVSFWSYRNVAF